MLDQNEDDCHVVAPDPTVRVGRQQTIQQVLHNLLRLLPSLDVSPYDFYQSLAILHVLLPNAVAAHHDELVLRGDWELFDIGVAGDHLLVIGKVFVFLVVKVRERTSQVQSSVHSPHHYLASCFLYPGFLDRRVRLVVFGKVEGLALPGEDTAGVSSIGREV